MNTAAHSESQPLLRIEGLRATILLNRPAHLNRLHAEDVRILRTMFLDLARNSTVRVLVITGSGRAFCAGYNIGELGSAEDGRNAKEAGEQPGEFESMVDALEQLSIPTICRFNGSVYGGATDLALACDFRVGIDTMELRMPAVRLGLHYYPSGLKRYVSRLGLNHAKRLFLLARAASAGELLEMGYLDFVVSHEALDDTVEALVHDLILGAPLAMEGMKCSLNEIALGQADINRLRARETETTESADLREGVLAWHERRQPSFQRR